MSTPRQRVRLGKIYADNLSFDEALSLIVERAENRLGGYVVTPNVDHVVMSQSNQALKQAYDHAAFSLVDGKPLLWWAKLLGVPFKEKISGSDLAEPLMQAAAKKGLRIFFLGAAEGVGLEAAEKLKNRIEGLNIVGIYSPPMGFEKNEDETEKIIAHIKKTDPHLVFFALGCPKQELLMAQWKEKIFPAVGLGVGATLDFIAGKVQRAPHWMSEAGLEWVYRIAQDPKRLAKRYLVQDRAILGIVLRSLKTSKGERSFWV